MKDLHPGRRLLLVFVASALLVPCAATAWWNDEWAGRKPFHVDTAAAGMSASEPIGGLVVLVRLHAGNFKFESAKEDGSDLRFVAGDDKTPLPFHLERYDALMNEALAWVAIPELKPGTRTDFWLYYKNPKAVAAEDAKGSYDPAASLVYHFGEKGTPRDSTGNGNHAVAGGAPAEGALIGRGLRLDGATTVQVPAGSLLAWAAGAKVTWSAWIRPADDRSTGVILSRRDGQAAFLVGVNEGKPYAEIVGDDGARWLQSTTPLAANSWHHLAVTAGDTAALYVDGALVAKRVALLPALDAPFLLGGDVAPAAPSPGPGPRKKRPAATPAEPPPTGFKGDLDELQLARVERPAGYLLASVISQGTDPGKFLSAGPEEETGGSSGGYFGIIIKSVTLDGWVIIGLCGVMAVVSWIVMSSKASYLAAVEKGNRRFLERFQKLGDDLPHLFGTKGTSPLAADKEFRHSPLFRIFEIGGIEVRKRTDSGRPISAEAIEAVRASLDAGMVREGQRLSSQLVLLTIAISGGPFLGLLGTVVGVMITFASIAAAGDVNVNAIAPGIAAALVATVAGLAVAIPALFGYNWLLTRVKEISASMQVFIDELVTKLAEAYSLADVHHLPTVHSVALDDDFDLASGK
jgi:biopolymer transport protein ExbB